MSLHISYIAHCNALCCLFSVSCWVKETNDLGEFTLCLVYSAQLWHIELENWSLSVWQITVSLACLRVANFSLLARNFHTTDEICKFVLQIILTFARAGQPSHYVQEIYSCFLQNQFKLVFSKCSPDQVCMQSRKVGKVSYSQGCLACAHISRTDTTSPTNVWKSPPHHSGCVTPGF